MNSRTPADWQEGVDRPDIPGPWRLMAMQIAWPSFLMAGVMEALVFSVVDPGSLRWFGASRIDWPVQAVYTVSFFLFWFIIATACGISRSLHRGSGAAVAD